MRKTAILVAVWLLGAAGAVAAATVGVSMVGNQVTDDRPAPLSAAQVREELIAATTTAPSTVPSTVPSTGPAANPPDVTVTTGTAVSSTVPATSTTSVGDAASDDPSEVRTYNLVGGTATLRFEPAGVTVVAATPHPGFSVDIEAEHVTGVKVEFEGDDHRSRVTGWWAGGPRDESREDD